VTVSVSRKENAVAIGTQLNIDDQTAVRVFVGETSVEFHCANTEVEMYEAELELFIQTARDALPRLQPTAKPAVIEPDHIGAGAAPVAVDGPQVSGTWVICEATEPLRYMVLRDAVELHWGQLTWTITGGALARLLDQARRAHAVLTQRLDCAVEALAPALEIPDNAATSADR
jgi:hypothetical protein